MKHAPNATSNATSNVTSNVTALEAGSDFRSVGRLLVKSSEEVRQCRGWLRPWSASFVALLVTFTMAGFAGAESKTEPLEDEFAKWQFSAGVELGLYGTSGEGDVSGSILTEPRATNIDTLLGDGGPNVVADQSDTQDVLSSALLGGTFGVMSPALFDGLAGSTRLRNSLLGEILLASRPRLFFDVSILPALTLETSVVRDGDPGQFKLPDDIPSGPKLVPERLVQGTGTNLTSQHQGVQFRASLGMAFTIVELEEGSLRIKPSLHYSRVENKVSAVARRAVRLLDEDPFVTVDGRTARFRSLDHFRTIGVSDESTEVYHGVGPAFELEYVTQEAFGPFGVSLFLKGTATRLLGDLETEFQVANADNEDETVTFRFKNAPWSYSASMGIRLLFSPDLDLFR